MMYLYKFDAMKRETPWEYRQFNQYSQGVLSLGELEKRIN